MTRAERARERVRRALQDTQAKRRDAIEGARQKLHSYTDDELDEITGRFAALSADAAARATAGALMHRGHSPSSADNDSDFESIKTTESEPPLTRRFTRAGKVAAAATTIGSTLATFAHWILHWF